MERWSLYWDGGPDFQLHHNDWINFKIINTNTFFIKIRLRTLTITIYHVYVGLNVLTLLMLEMEYSGFAGQYHPGES